MRRITVKTIVETTFEVPLDVEMDRIRQLALSELSVAEEITDEIAILHGNSIDAVFYGDREYIGSSVEHCVFELPVALTDLARTTN